MQGFLQLWLGPRSVTDPETRRIRPFCCLFSVIPAIDSREFAGIHPSLQSWVKVIYFLGKVPPYSSSLDIRVVAWQSGLFAVRLQALLTSTAAICIKLVMP
jgi:hypothetical protein